MNRLKPNKLLGDDKAMMPGSWNVLVIDNAGKTTGVYQYCYNSALAYAALVMMPDVHIIIIEKDRVEFQRFDRACIVDSNNWREVECLTS